MSRSSLMTSKGAIAFTERGEGDALILWPSLFSDRRLNDDMIEPLAAAGWKTIAVDGPGFGASTPAAGIVLPEAYAELVIEFAGALNIDRFFFAGTSWGGQIGAHLGARYGDRISGLLLMNTPLKPSAGGHLAELWLTRLLGNTRIAADGVARSMLAAQTVRDHPERAQRFKSYFAGFDRRAAAQTVDTTLRHFAGLERILPLIGVPTTMMLGANDAIYPPDSLIPIARLAPRANIVVVPNCGHLIPLEAPSAAVDQLNALRSAVAGVIP